MANCSPRSEECSCRGMTNWKKLLFLAAVGGSIAAARHFGPPKRGVDWQKRFERMPDNARPKWMFNNIKAIRQSTDRILELLEEAKGPVSGAATA